MTNENELHKLREELKQIQEGTRRTRKRAVFGFGILVLALIICIVYAFVQQVAAVKNAEEALRQKDMADNALVERDRNGEEAIRNMEEARRQEALFKEQQALARILTEDLAKCKGKK